MENDCVAITAHRTPALGLTFSLPHRELLTSFAKEILLEYRPRQVISGFALGGDLAFADAAIQVGIHLVAAIPFKGQEDIWPNRTKEYYRGLLAKADELSIISEGSYSPEKMFRRNEWMVDRADSVLALWDGRKTGGTAQCVGYAVKQGKNITNLWERWVQFRGECS